MDAAKLSVVIDTQATGDGARKAGQDVASVAAAAKQAAPAMAEAGKGSKEMADGLGKSVAVGTATTQLLQNLGQVGQGGAAGMFAFGRSILAFGQVIKAVLVGAGPIGIAIAALGLLAGAAFALRDAFKPAGESADEMAKRIADLNKSKLDAVTAQQKQLTEATNEAVTAIDKELAAMDKLADMRTARLIEEEKARGKQQGIAPEVTERNVTRIRRDAEDSKIGRDLSAADQKARVIEDSASEAEQARITADARRNLLLGLKSDLDNATEAARVYRNEVLVNTVKRAGGSSKFEDEKLAGLYDERNRARSALEKQIGGPDKSGENYTKALAAVDEVLNKATEASRAAAKAAEDAATAAAKARDLEGGLAPDRRKLRTAEDTNSRAQTEAEKAAIEKLQEKRAKEQAIADAKMKESGSAGYLGRAAVGSPVDAESFRRVFPQKAAEMDALIEQAKAKQAAAPKPTADKKPAGNTIIGPDGQPVDLTRQPTGPTMIGPDGRPVAVQSGQPTGPGRRAYREGSDGLAPGSDNTANAGPNSLTPLVDSVKAAGGPMDAASAALQEAASTVLPDFEPAATAAQTIAASLKEAADTELPDFTPAAEAAAALATTVSTYASTNAEFASTTTSALSATATVVSDHDKSIGALKDEMKTIKSQMSVLRSKVK